MVFTIIHGGSIPPPPSLHNFFYKEGYLSRKVLESSLLPTPSATSIYPSTWLLSSTDTDYPLPEPIALAWLETSAGFSLPPVFYSLRYPLNISTNPLEAFIAPVSALNPLPSYLHPLNVSPTNLFPKTPYQIQLIYEDQCRTDPSFYSLFEAYHLSPLFTTGLVSFLELVSGMKVKIRVDLFTRHRFTPLEYGRILLWKSHLINFERIFSRSLFLTDAMMVFYTLMQTKDLLIFVRWLQRTMYKVSFWRYRSFLYFLRYAFRYVIAPNYESFNFLGVRLRLKGKISVAGNARTRKIEHTIGTMSSSTKDVAVLHNLSTINTFTGVLGLQVWICFRSPLSPN